MVILGGGLVMGVAVGAFLYHAYQTLPVYGDFTPSLSSTIYDTKGREVYKLAGDENRTLVKLSEIPLEVQQAFVATEDRRFYDHFGVDVWRLGGSIWSDIKYLLGIKGAQLEGGSTITMQLARNAFLTLDQTPMRKVQEMMIAINLERRYTKPEILEKYLNEVSFGYQADGIEAAAHAYFNKKAKDLTLSEGALLAGILKGPTQYHPVLNPEAAMNRRATVLNLMVDQGYITKERAEQLKAEKPKIDPAPISPSAVTFTGDWYVDHVIRLLTDAELAKQYNLPHFSEQELSSSGLKIYLAMDKDVQAITDAKLKEIIPERTKYYGSNDVPEGAAVVMNHKTGQVLAITGGLQHDGMLTFNRATMAYRQPGSAIKPLVAYFPAIDQLGWGPATIIDDSPVRLSEDMKKLWPDNYEFRYLGLLPMRTGLEQSINTMAVRSLQAVGTSKAIEYAKKFGLNSVVSASESPSENDQNLALALGGLTRGVTVMDMTEAYGILGSLGTKVDPVFVTRIENRNGEVIYQAQPKKTVLFKKESVWLMVDVMKGSIQRGTSAYESKGFHGWPVAGKTGTTENWHDAWFIGFSSELVTGVWTGYDDGVKHRLPSNANGAWTGAGPPTRIWTAIMNELIKSPPPDWERPSGVTQVQICRLTGLPPTSLCPPDQITADWFRKGTEPKASDGVLVTAKVVKQPWINPKTLQPMERYFLWQEGCPGVPEERVMIKRPTPWPKHPSDPWNIERYWPRDWVNELPTEKCLVQPPTTQPPGQNPPGTQPPGLQPPGQQPPGTQPPGTQPPGTQPPGTQPPGTQPPGTQPPDDKPGDGQKPIFPPVLPPIEPPGTGR
jgi:penicillin-binding protein 1A